MYTFVLNIFEPSGTYFFFNSFWSFFISLDLVPYKKFC